MKGVEATPLGLGSRADVRSTDLDAVLAGLATPASCEVIGISNIGKSQVLRKLQSSESRARIRQPGEAEPIVAFADVIADYDSNRAFYDRTLRAIATGVVLTGGTDSMVEPIESARRSIQRSSSIVEIRSRFEDVVVDILRGSGLEGEAPRRLVIVYDEFERAFKMLDAATFQQLRRIRDEFEHGEDARLQFAVGTCQRLENLRQDEEGDPTQEFRELFERCQVYVRPLEAEDAKRFLAFMLEHRRGFSLDDAQRESLLWLAGGHPELMTLVLDLLQSGEVCLDPTDDELSELFSGVPVIENECRRLFDELSRPTQLALLVSAQGGGLVADSPLHGRLRDKGLIRDGGTGARLFSPIFHAWARRLPARLTEKAKEPVEAGLVFDPQRNIVWVNGQETEPLTELQRKLMHFLWAESGSNLTRSQIVEAVWPGNVDPGASFNSLIKGLQKRVEPDPSTPRYLVAEAHGIYRLYPQGKS